jgi:predicted  nucleic acid-binding Zn-ribbon protein
MTVDKDQPEDVRELLEHIEVLTEQRERLQAELDRVTGERDHLQNYQDSWLLERDYAAICEERDRYRGALEAIRTAHADPGEPGASCVQGCGGRWPCLAYSEAEPHEKFWDYV